MVDLSTLLSSDNQSSIFTCGLLLPKEQENAAISICNRIAENNPDKLKFLLNKVTHPPYVRLYETVLPGADIQTAIDHLEHLAGTMIRFHMDWGEIERSEHFVAIWGQLSEPLRLFHEAVLVEINPLRQGYFKEKYIEERDEHEFSGTEEKSFEKWGSPWAEPYAPHMILAKATPTFNVNKFTPEWEFKHCLFRGLLIGLRSENGDFTHVFQFNFAESTHN